MDHRNEFPQDSRARVDAAEVTAERDFAKAEQSLGPSLVPRKYQSAVEKLLEQYVTSVLFAFADEAIQMGTRGIWHASCIQSKVEEFGGNLIVGAQGKCYHRNGYRFERTQSWDFPIEIWQEIKGSERWLAFLDQVVEVADAQAASAASNSSIPEHVTDARAARTIENSKMSSVNADSDEKSLKPSEGTTAEPEVAKESTGIEGSKKKRGPQAKMKFHSAVAAVLGPFGPNWKEHLEQIAEELGKREVPPLAAWTKRNRPAKSWRRAVEYYPEVVVKALEYSLKMAAKDIAGKPSQTLPNLR